MNGRSSEAFLEPAFGIDAYRDAAAAIRCLSVGDGEGTYAVLTGTDTPRNVAFMLTSIAYSALCRAGLDAAAIDLYLADVGRSIADALLDQPRPSEWPQGVMPRA